MRERVDELNPGGARPPGIWYGTQHPAPTDPSILELAVELVRIFREAVAKRREGLVAPATASRAKSPTDG